jgi:hypothetical protein
VFFGALARKFVCAVFLKLQNGVAGARQSLVDSGRDRGRQVGLLGIIFGFFS